MEKKLQLPMEDRRRRKLAIYSFLLCAAALLMPIVLTRIAEEGCRQNNELAMFECLWVLSFVVPGFGIAAVLALLGVSAGTASRRRIVLVWTVPTAIAALYVAFRMIQAFVYAG